MKLWNNKEYLASGLFIIIQIVMIALIALVCLLGELGLFLVFIVLSSVVVSLKYKRDFNIVKVKTDDISRVMGYEYITVTIYDKYKTRHKYFGSVVYILIFNYKGVRYEKEVDKEIYETIEIGERINAMKVERRKYGHRTEVEIEIHSNKNRIIRRIMGWINGITRVF